jgi:hypothetical protein
MKSECAFGRKSHFARLVPSPVPNQPPDPIAINPWINWYPDFLGSAHGSSHDSKNRVRRYASPKIR